MQVFSGMSAVQSLSLQYDGTIPRHLLTAAEKIDAAARKTGSPDGEKPSTARIRVGAVKMKPEMTIDFMALAMVRAFHARQIITEDDMHQAGFSDAQIGEYRDRAHQKALLWEPRIAHIADAA